jgi:hypothetical protein
MAILTFFKKAAIDGHSFKSKSSPTKEKVFLGNGNNKVHREIVKWVNLGIELLS